MNIGLFGIGTIGSGVFEQINEEFGNFSESTKIPAKITKVLDKDTTKKADNVIITNNPSDILDDESIEIIISLMGGIDFEYEQIKNALNKGKHVVTANKAIIGEHLAELTELAKKNNVMFRYEASVGGGIPIIETLEKQSRNNEISEIKGILNGTSNYILTKMINERASFENTLKEAQVIGFAEANPDSDLNGDDVARKIAILSSLAYKTPINSSEISIRGIQGITQADITDIIRMGYNIKHVAQSKNENNSISISVEPVLVKKNDIYSSVNNEFNIVTLIGDKTGELQLYGKGAGKDATANAVVQDVLDIIEALDNGYSIDLPEFTNVNELEDNNRFEGNYYLRINKKNSKGLSLEKVLDILGNYVEPEHINSTDDYTFIYTKETNSDRFKQLIDELDLEPDDFFYARILD